MASSLIDHAIDAAGFGRLQLTTLVAAGLTWSGDAMEMSVMAYVLPSLKAEWQVSQAAADSLASVIFAGMLIGALGWGTFSDAYGRRFGWLLTAALTAVAGLLSALAPSWQLFLLFRILVGIGLAGTNLGFALSSELLPRLARRTCSFRKKRVSHVSSVRARRRGALCSATLMPPMGELERVRSS